MIVLGIDPGSRYTGWGVVEAKGSKLSYRSAGRISLKATKTNLPERLGVLTTEIDQLLVQVQPDLVSIESLFQGINPRSLIVLAHARGVIVSRVAQAGLPMREFTPALVKQTVTGNGRAEKSQIAKMVEVLLSLRKLDSSGKRRSADVTDALAIAICGAQSRAL